MWSTLTVLLFAAIGLYLAEQSRRSREHLSAIRTALELLSDTSHKEVQVLDTIARNTKAGGLAETA